MGNIYHHSNPVHLFYHFNPKIAQAVIFRRIRRRIANIVILGMAKGDVPGPHLIKFFDIMYIIPDGIAIFNPDKNNAFTFFFQPVSIIRGKSNAGSGSPGSQIDMD